MRRTTVPHLLILGLAVMLLGACTIPSAPVTPAGHVAADTPEPVATTVALPTGETLNATQVSGEETPPPTEPPAPKPVRTELEATDPTTVSLTSGRPILVEFFAFW